MDLPWSCLLLTVSHLAALGRIEDTTCGKNPVGKGTLRERNLRVLHVPRDRNEIHTKNKLSLRYFTIYFLSTWVFFTYSFSTSVSTEVKYPSKPCKTGNYWGCKSLSDVKSAPFKLLPFPYYPFPTENPEGMKEKRRETWSIKGSSYLLLSSF